MSVSGSISEIKGVLVVSSLPWRQERGPRKYCCIFLYKPSALLWMGTKQDTISIIHRSYHPCLNSLPRCLRFPQSAPHNDIGAGKGVDEIPMAVIDLEVCIYFVLAVV